MGNYSASNVIKAQKSQKPQKSAAPISPIANTSASNSQLPDPDPYAALQKLLTFEALRDSFTAGKLLYDMLTLKESGQFASGGIIHNSNSTLNVNSSKYAKGSIISPKYSILNYSRGSVVNPSSVMPQVNYSSGGIEKISHFLPQSTVMGYIKNAPQAKGGVTIPDPVTTLTRDVRTAAGGGMKDLELYNDDSLNYFRNMSNTFMTKAADGGIGLNTRDVRTAAGGGMKDLELYNNNSLNYFRNMSNTVMTKAADGGMFSNLINWWNKGRNTRVPNESNVSWRTLMADDRNQLTRTNEAFREGASGVKGWRPLKAFTPEMVKTGPTPAVRQAFERPVRAIGSAAMTTVAAPLTRRLPLLGDMLFPEGTSEYDQISGPNSYKNNPAYKKLEMMQNNLTSKTNNKPTVVPLPPEYIKIPGSKSKKEKDMSTIAPPPGVKDMPASPFRKDMGVYK